ncbi:cell division control protein 42 homolog [Mya arenaria]|uniref:cell division control protein 42 homolog n=1 Tax=Mya arenaria TaxID=6604 RepID=UPI0022E2287E|nr:cell division control protein 42 homolog [Mya arenaria]
MVVLRGDLIKCVVVGDPAVGKTSLLMNYATNRFPSQHVPAVFDNYAGSLEVSRRRYNLHLIDTTEQGGSKSLEYSYPGTDVFVVCFSVVKPETFTHMHEHWIPDIQARMGDTPFIVVGTQADLRDDPEVLRTLQVKGQSPVRQRDAASLCRKVGSVCYFETSTEMKKRLRRVMNDAFVSVFCPKAEFNIGCCLQPSNFP